jgi:hypothetical protein
MNGIDKIRSKDNFVKLFKVTSVRFITGLAPPKHSSDICVANSLESMWVHLVFKQGLPDGIFANQKSVFLENVGIFYGHFYVTFGLY